jgi:hypothetical protein
MFTCKLGNLSKRQGISKSDDAEDMWFLLNMKWKNTTWIWNNPTGVPTRPKWQVISRMAQLFGFAWNGTTRISPLSYVCPMVFPWSLDVPMTYPEELAQAKARCWDAVPWFLQLSFPRDEPTKAVQSLIIPTYPTKMRDWTVVLFLQRDNFTTKKWGISGYSVERRTWRLHQERSGRGVQRHCPFCRKMDHSKND